MTRKIPLTLALAALVGFAAPAFAAEHGATHDPQAATSTTKHKAAPAKHAKAKAVKGRHAKASKATKSTEQKAATPAAQPATK